VDARNVLIVTSDEQIPPDEIRDQEPKPNYGRVLSRQKTVLFIEDDQFVAQEYGQWLAVRGFKVSYACDVNKAIYHAHQYRHFDFVIVDIRMSSGSFADQFQTVMGTKTGILIADELMNNYLPDATFLALTNSERADDQAWFEARGFAFHVKRDTHPQKFASYLRRRAMRERPKVFIVHGHDHHALRALKHYLQYDLRFEEPVVLWERKSRGATVIEKLELYAEEAELVFVLMTPDDYVPASGRSRPRQNVLLEYGYFLGRLGRSSGKVILLYKQGVEMPSDLSGIVAINITNGILSADEEIRREISGYR
jgi:CheY-like chemotaxis protein